MVTQERLKYLFTYDKDAGNFHRKKQGGRCKIGSVAGSINRHGYTMIMIDYKNYSAHRLSFLYIYGYLPVKEIDHINGNKSDNRIINLREASRSENQQNVKKCQKNNESGLLGVGFDKRRNKYIARISVNGVSKFIGSFISPDDAHSAYINEKKALHPFS